MSAAQPIEISDQHLYQEIFRLSPEAIVIISKTGYVLKANGRMREWLGYTSSEIIGKHLLQLPFLNLKSREIILKNFLKRVTGKEVGDYTAEFITKGHKVRIGKIRGSLIKDGKGHIIADLVMISEATEEFLSLEARQKKEKILEAVSYAAGHFLKSKATQHDYEKVLKKIGESTDLDRIALVMNDLLMQRYEWVKSGFKPIIRDKEYPNFFSQKNFRGLIRKMESGDRFYGVHDDFSDGMKEFCDRYQIKALMFMPIFVKKKLWAYLSVQECEVAKEWSAQEIESLSIAAELIGAAIEKNQVELQLRETVEYWKHEKEKVTEEIQNTQKFKQAVENSTDGVMITTTEPKIVYVNPAWEKMTGFTVDEAVDQNPTILNWSETKPEVFTALWEALAKGKPFVTEEVMNTRKDGSSFLVRLSVYPIREKGQNMFYVGLFEDITKRSEIDRMKTEFISIASHQLNTPLSAMKWFLELLLKGKAGELTEKQLDFVQNIADSNMRMIALVRSLLNISRIESGRIIIEPRLTSIKKMVDDVVVELSPLTDKKKQKVVISISADLPRIKLDPRLIRHVYMNLLSNSTKYSPDGTTIEISVEQKGQEVVSHVKDQGYGIPKADQDKMFTKFFRAPNVVRMEADGSGLGLYLVKIVIESSGGKIWFTSEENKGTDFAFSLPIKGVKPKEGEVVLGA